MSKIERLKLKYPNVNKTTFIKFVNGDKTPTKKYLEYMLKMWTKQSYVIKTTLNLIEAVHEFDDLIPYIPLKDIYHFEYNDFEFLLGMIERAREEREERTFNKDEHCDTLLENDEYFLIRPKTHRGSLKYGYNTKWCTASRHNKPTFDRYYNNGVLGYLISKTERSENINKVAFYIDYSQPALSGDISIYDSKDKEINEKVLLENGWNENDIVKIIMTFRYVSLKLRDKKESLDFIKKFEKDLENLKFNDLEKHIKNINENHDISVLNDFIQKINNVQENIKKYGN